MATSRDVQGWRDRLVAAAQAVLDEWVQDEEGFDEELGQGGACQDVAAAMRAVLDEEGVEDCLEVYTDFDGGHVFSVLRLDDGIFQIDIPPSVYEAGAGYVWRKKEGVVLAPDDVSLFRVDPPMSSAEFHHRYGDGQEIVAEEEPEDALDLVP